MLIIKVWLFIIFYIIKFFYLKCDGNKIEGLVYIIFYIVGIYFFTFLRLWNLLLMLMFLLGYYVNNIRLLGNVQEFLSHLKIICLSHQCYGDMLRSQSVIE